MCFPATSSSLFSGLICRFRYSPIERFFYKFYGINCCPKLGTKLLDRFFHRRRQVAPPVNRLTHRFFDGSQHFLYCNFTVGSRHSAVAPSFLPGNWTSDPTQAAFVEVSAEPIGLQTIDPRSTSISCCTPT